MSQDGGTRLIVSCWSLLVMSAILLSLRTYCKIWRSRGLWWDDYLALISWGSLAIAVSINTYIVTLGFGSHIWTISEENLRTISLYTIFVATFSILSTTLSKTSFALTLYRIAMDQWMKYVLVFVIITSNISMNLVWIFGLAKCTPFERVLDSSMPGTCWDQHKLLRYQLFAAYYSAALDFFLALLPWQILMGMSIRKREKLGIAIAMSLGAVAGATAIVKSVMLVSITSLDFTFDRVDLTIWSMAEPAVSIMAISIPVLRMLYHEIKSSNRSYFRNRIESNSVFAGTGSSATEPSSSSQATSTNVRKFHSKYGQNSVVIMSNGAWEDSQEALQAKNSSENQPPQHVHGVLKTEEVRVEHENLPTTSDENPIELAPVPETYQWEAKSRFDI